MIAHRTPPTLADALADIDPRRVPLVHGSEVSTTVALVWPGSSRPIPMGTIGRITALHDDDTVDVRLVGRGVLRVARGSVVPRNDGQMRFALTRAATERALAPCVVYEATVGSRAWGLADQHSDHDTRGVLLWPFPWACARARVPDVVTSADGSHTLWEFGRTCSQALRADPNTLEALYVPDFVAHDPIGAELRDARESFVSQEIYGSFGRYALAQSGKLRKSLRLAEHRGFVLSWLRQDPSATLDAVAARLAAQTLPDLEPRAGQLRAKQYLKQLYASLHDQGVIGASSFSALAQLATQGDVQMPLPRELRPKNAYNLLRIVSCAVQWLATGTPLIQTRGRLRDQLLAIKGGDVPLATALSWTDAAAEALEDARANSVLPKHPDFARIDRLLLAAREQAAARWLARQPGPWGQDAPPLPDSDTPDANSKVPT